MTRPIEKNHNQTPLTLQICGRGRLGSLIEELVKKQTYTSSCDLLSLIPAVDRNTLLTTDRPNNVAPADVVIDVALASGIAERTEHILKSGSSLVIGSTGWDPNLKKGFRELAIEHRSCILIAANFSRGIWQLLISVASTLGYSSTQLLDAISASKKLVDGHTIAGSEQREENIDVERYFPFNQMSDPSIESGSLLVRPTITLTEQHAKSKKDAPSGTALLLGTILTSLTGSAPQINSLRSDTSELFHRIEIHYQNEKIELKHSLNDRRPLAQGAIEAARWLHAMKLQGYYGLFELEHWRMNRPPL